MKCKELKDTSIPESYSIDIEAKLNMTLLSNHVENMYKSIFTSIASFLGLKEHTSNDKPVALVVKDTKDNFKAAAIVCHESGGDEEEDKGNFTLTFTFDESEIEGIEEIFYSYDPAFVELMGRISLNQFRFSFSYANTISGAVSVAFDNIKKFLDMNAEPDEVIGVELPGYFIAQCEIVDGEKVFGLVPGDNIKLLVKDDAALSKLNV